MEAAVVAAAASTVKLSDRKWTASMQQVNNIVMTPSVDHSYHLPRIPYSIPATPYFDAMHIIQMWGILYRVKPVLKN